MKDLEGRFDRRWDLVVVGILTNMSLGTVYSWSVFREPLVYTFGFTTAQTATPYSVFLALFAFSMPLGGWLLGHIGTRATLAVGAFFVATGWFAAGFVSSISALALTYGVVAGFGVGLSYGVPLAVVASWFPRRRGLAIGLTLGGFGLSPFVTAPVAELLIEHVGVAMTFRILGVAFLGILATATLWMHRAPHDAVRAGLHSDGIEIGPREMLRSPIFYGLWITFALGTFAGLTAIGMSAAYGIEVVGIRRGAAAAAVAGFGVFNGIGRPIFGWLTDHLGARRTAILAFVIIIVGSVSAMLAASLGVVAYLVGFSLLWLLLGGWLAIAPTATTTFFGPLHYAANYGIMYTAYGVGALTGGVASAYLTNLTGTLVTTFWAMIATAVAGVLVAAALLPRPQAVEI